MNQHTVFNSRVADPIRTGSLFFTLMQIWFRILLLIKLVSYKSLQLFNFEFVYFDAADSAFHTNADLNPTSHNNTDPFRPGPASLFIKHIQRFHTGTGKVSL